MNQSVAPPPLRRETTSVTLADLVALVAGAALAAWLPWWSRPELLDRGVGWWVWLRGETVWLIISEALGKACLALTPVILARRATYGGIVRPGEFLAACVGFRWLVSGLDLRLMLAWVGPRIGAGPSVLGGVPLELWNEWHYLMHWTRAIGLLSIAIAASLLLGFGRRRQPGWLVSLLLVLSWLGFRDGGSSVYFGGLYAIISPGPGAVRELIRYGAWLPFLSLDAIPIVAVLLPSTSTGRPRTWLERTCPVLALSEVAIQILILGFILTLFAGPPLGDIWVSFMLTLTSILAAFAIAIFLVRRFRPAWNHLFGVGYDGSDPESPQPEA